MPSASHNFGARKKAQRVGFASLFSLSPCPKTQICKIQIHIASLRHFRCHHCVPSCEASCLRPSSETALFLAPSIQPFMAPKSSKVRFGPRRKAHKKPWRQSGKLRSVQASWNRHTKVPGAGQQFEGCRGCCVGFTALGAWDGARDDVGGLGAQTCRTSRFRRWSSRHSKGAQVACACSKGPATFLLSKDLRQSNV